MHLSKNDEEGIPGDYPNPYQITPHASSDRYNVHTYYVKSAQQQPSSRSNSRFRNATYEQTSYYEVKLNAWSCSCPAFAFSAFPATSSGLVDEVTTSHGEVLAANQDTDDWRFGGLSKGNDMPVCKHLVACVLVEHTAMFASFVEEMIVSAEEMAGWAAGWGD